MDQFWKYSGIVLWGLIGLWAFLRLTLGKSWPLKIGSRLYFGQGLIDATKKLFGEVEQRQVQKDTVAEFTAHVIWRLTRIGIFAALIAAIPLILLWRQNDLIANQNRLFELQNIKIDTQTTLLSQQTKLFNRQNITLDSQNVLFSEQNNNIATQTDLFLDQNLLVRFQNTKIDSQISLAAVQNDRLNLQNNLIEADRRSSLVFLMSNILDKVDEEIKEQRDTLSKKPGFVEDRVKYRLSKPLVSRVVGLSRAFKPYRVMQGDTLSQDLQSPERGQLFIALMENNLDSATQNTIVSNGDFANAVIGKINLSSADLCDAALINADLRDADLRHANLRAAMLRETDLRDADLVMADLYGANLHGANLMNANLHGANLINANLSSTKLSSTKLSSTNLRYTKLRSAYLFKADLRAAYLFQADLRGASLINADLRAAKLRAADLINADLRYTKLRSADLSVANLSGANLSGANLHGANLRGTRNLTKEQLLSVKTLYQCKNLAPEIRQQLRVEKPCLFEDPDGPKACK